MRTSEGRESGAGFIDDSLGAQQAFATLGRASGPATHLVHRSGAGADLLTNRALRHAFADADVHSLTIMIMGMIVNKLYAPSALFSGTRFG